MALISSSIANLVGGVSQQPPALRLPTTCERMENAWPSVVSGLLKRPGSQHIASVPLTISGGVAGYMIERDASYRYMVVITNGDVKVIDINTGNLQTVNFPDGKTYLNSTSPVDTFRFVTFGDFTFIANRNVVVKTTTAVDKSGGALTPDGTVATIGDLPTSTTTNAVYYVTSAKKYYKYTYIQPIPAVYGWNQTASAAPAGFGDTTSSPPNGSSELELQGYTYVGTSLPSGSSIGQKVYIAVPNELGVLWNYYGYTSYLISASAPGYYIWEEVKFENDGVRLDPTNRGYVYVTQAAYNTYYSVYINGVLKAQYLTPNGASGSAAVPDTSQIAVEVANALNASGYTTVRTGSTITITNLAADDKIQVQGGTGDKSLRGIRDTVQSFSDVPVNAPEGTILRVQGDVEEAGDDYYVIYRNGVWEETYGWGQKIALDASTMPHVLIREADGTWTFKKHEWSTREVGDSDSNADPSFVDVTINDIFVYTNRLGFLADENVILSEADNFENFYRATAAQTLDSDRIDVAVLHNNVDILQHAIAYNRDLLLLSNANQFRFSYQNFLSAKQAQVRYTTSFNVSSRIRPINMGLSVYFVDDRPDYTYTKLLEYYPKENVTADDADEVTSPVPEYVPSDIIWMAGSNRADAVMLCSNNEPSSLYFYKFYWAGEEKVQTSWSKWKFNDCTKIHWGGFSGTFLYLLVQRSNGLNLERIRFDEDVFDSASNYEILVDRLTVATSKTYDPVTDRTYIITPWTTTYPTVEIVSSGDGINGYRHVVTKHAINEFSVAGDISTHTVTVGIPYTFLFEFSPVYPRQAKGRGEVVILDGRLQVRYISLEYHDTAFFQTYLVLPGRDTFTSTFSATTVGSTISTLGQQPFASGVYRIPVMGKNTDARLWITNDAPFPSAFGSAEWQGQYTPKSVQRM